MRSVQLTERVVDPADLIQELACDSFAFDRRSCRAVEVCGAHPRPVSPRDSWVIHRRSSRTALHATDRSHGCDPQRAGDDDAPTAVTPAGDPRARLRADPGAATPRSQPSAASWASVLSLRPASNSRTRADSAAGTSTTVSPDATSCCANNAPTTRRAFHGPQPRLERCRPTQQPVALSTISTNRHFAHELFVAVDHRGSVRSLMRIDPNDEHEGPPQSEVNAAAGTPDAGMPFLFRATPQHGNRRTASSLGSQPNRRQGILETSPPAPSTLRTTPQRVTSNPLSGQSVRA